jgi:hypothetical protein
MVETDFIDLTPKGAGGEGAAGIKATVFQESEIRQIVENPNRLTKEGIEKKIELWNRSANAHVKIKYNTMLKRCEKIAPSGVTEDGFQIYSRDEKGNPKWISEHPVKKVEKKPSFKSTEVKNG